MSKRTRDSSSRTASQPAMLPVIVIDQAETGDGHDALFRVTMTDPRTDAVVTDSVPAQDLGSVVARHAEDVGSPVRVEVHQTDGLVHADIIHPPATDPVAPQVNEAAGPIDQAAAVGGFVPGEQILVAIVVQTGYADAHGRLRLPLDAFPHGPDQVPVGAHDQFVLVGATSHVAATRPGANLG